MTVQNVTALKINNLPLVYDGVIEVPLTALVLAVDENGNFATQDGEALLVINDTN